MSNDRSAWRLIAAAIAAVVIAAGCSTTKLDEAPVETVQPATTGAAGSGAAGSGAAQSNVATVDLSKTSAADAAALAQKVVYFDFDSYAIKDEYRPMLEAHAKALRANHNQHLTLEGHTDERGGREYNLALGQKRADAVMKALIVLGVPANQLEAVSFGEEKPADPGHDEAAWAKNRRVVLKDK